MNCCIIVLKIFFKKCCEYKKYCNFATAVTVTAITKQIDYEVL